MKKSILFSLSLSLLIFSCGEKSGSQEAESLGHTSGDASTAITTAVSESKTTSSIIDSYLAVKDALVADDQATAAAKSQDLVAALKSYDIASAKGEDLEELERLQVEATDFAEKLSSGDIAAQRESFQALSVVMKDLLKIAGTDRTLYQQYCPMYKNNTGGIWLSASEDIKNPLFGSSMLTCGKVEETIAMN
ncbi:uncharacterized protein DUF3347 [Algoriphagus boseongensis]|uniref:Uncharacterized protein DUF3347 n=1 Tax=Algoriphagus boseongensis TaxID=1442587 RepID=A0A4R6T9N5_9BACT|nr:DUF3347 domain-containing protein [Algoriphagus boseongensis]TDQ18949.1 uncharacterized protein DUF3347 [Algoriphagus boseongensis]